MGNHSPCHDFKYIITYLLREQIKTFDTVSVMQLGWKWGECSSARTLLHLNCTSYQKWKLLYRWPGYCHLKRDYLYSGKFFISLRRNASDLYRVRKRLTVRFEFLLFF